MNIKRCIRVMFRLIIFPIVFITWLCFMMYSYVIVFFLYLYEEDTSIVFELMKEFTEDYILSTFK